MKLVWFFEISSDFRFRKKPHSSSVQGSGLNQIKIQIKVLLVFIPIFFVSLKNVLVKILNSYIFSGAKSSASTCLRLASKRRACWIPKWAWIIAIVFYGLEALKTRRRCSRTFWVRIQRLKRIVFIFISSRNVTV